MSNFCCPKCKGNLKTKDNSYLCLACGENYRQFAGIPNFKAQELYPGEWEILEEVVEDYNKLSFMELMERMDNNPRKNVLPCELRRYLRFAEMSPAEKQKWLTNYTKETIVKEGQLQLQITLKLLDQTGYQLKRGRCLDIGCGRGPWVVAANDMFDETYALDVDLASLIIAQKYCEENRIENIHFLSATSSSLPFCDNSFDMINSQAVLEHVDHQLNTLKEIQRVLKPQACFTGDSVNRYNLFTPEPHIELRLVTFMPKKIAHRISLLLKKLPYDDIKPLSYNELHTMLKQAFGNQFKIVPYIETSKKSLTFKIMKYLPNKFLDIFTDTHYIIAFKNGGQKRQ